MNENDYNPLPNMDSKNQVYKNSGDNELDNMKRRSSSSRSIGEERKESFTKLPIDDDEDASEFTSRTAILREEKPAPTHSLEVQDDDDVFGDEKKEEVGRGNWTGRFDFLLSLLGYSVGLGNVWRFPYLAYSNGGGAFLIPFIIMLMLVGIPLMFMELAFGQYASLGPIAIFDKFCPLFHGLGYGMVIISGIVSLYYNMIIAYTLFYLFASFTSTLPWVHCLEKWRTHHCYSFQEADVCQKTNGSLFLNNTCFNSSIVDQFSLNNYNLTKRSPAEDYFNNEVLSITPGIDDMGGFKWQLVLCLFGAWVIVFLCLSKGVQTSGKVVYFTALFPYVVLIILFFRGVTLPGADKGIIYYLTPDFNRLTEAKVWVDAAVQIFFSLSPAWGGLITLSSYNKFNNNCYKDALIVSISNICTSIFAGFVIFSIVGFLAQELKEDDIGKVISSGPGLAFIVYPEVVTRLPISPLWSVLFFFMLLTLGLDSQFALLETVTTAILDKFPDLREKKTWVVGSMSLLGFIGGLVLCTNGGMYVLNLMDTYAASWSVFLLAMTESILIGWVYGADRFCENIEEMIGERSRLWKNVMAVFWKFLSPATLLFLLFFNWIQYKPVKYNEYVYPLWANGLGWCMALAPVVVIPCVMIYKVIYARPTGSFWQVIRELMKPSHDWGPAARVRHCSGGRVSKSVMYSKEKKPSITMTYEFEEKD